MSPTTDNSDLTDAEFTDAEALFPLNPLTLRTLILAISLLCLGGSCALPWQPTTEKKDITDRFEAANDTFSRGEVRGAIDAYHALLKMRLKPPTWGKVTFNLFSIGHPLLP